MRPTSSYKRTPLPPLCLRIKRREPHLALFLFSLPLALCSNLIMALRVPSVSCWDYDWFMTCAFGVLFFVGFSTVKHTSDLLINLFCFN